MVSQGDLSEFIPQKIELTKKMRALESSYANDKITQSTYEYLKREITGALIKLEANMEISTKKDETLLTEPPLESNLELQSNFQSKIEMDMEKSEPANVEPPESLAKKVGQEEAFRFYEDVGKPTEQMALTLEDFARIIRTVPLVSLEFHQKRGDFANWIREIFDNNYLAGAVENLTESGECLRTGLIEIIEGDKRHNIFPCPNCGKEIDPKKIWNMVGRPTKEGKRLHLTLGYYKCQNCEKSFRQVLAKKLM